MNILVIGAGVFGICTALKLSESNRVTLIDSNDDIMLNASKFNHNRLHFGFHYPRSIETAIQSIEGFKSFHQIFKDSVVDNFPNYYMVEKNSKVSSSDYSDFCNKLSLKIVEEYPKIDMDFSNIDSSFLTNEPVYDYETLKKILKNMICKSTINLILNKTLQNKSDVDGYDVVINASYFNINKINRLFNLPESTLRFQNVVIPIFRKNMNKIGLTIMDGKYCSIMPKGFDDNYFLLYHVRNSVICQSEGYNISGMWELEKKIIKNKFFKKNIYDKIIISKKIDKIYDESIKYYSFLKDCEPDGYLQTIRALPINEDDSRMSDITFNCVDNIKVISILSGKITTCWKIAEDIKKMI